MINTMYICSQSVTNLVSILISLGPFSEIVIAQEAMVYANASETKHGVRPYFLSNFTVESLIFQIELKNLSYIPDHFQCSISI